MAAILKTNGNILTVSPKNGTDFSLAELQAIVGGYIQIVYLDNGDIMVVNEEGKINGLPQNDAATRLYGADIIVGDVLVCRTEQVK